MEASANLDFVTVEKLQQLVQINLDSEKGFNEASLRINSQCISTVFSELGSQRRKNALELKDALTWNGKGLVENGSNLAAFANTWIDLSGLLSGRSSYAILSEAERSEETIKKAYKYVLTATTGSAMNDVLTRQYAVVKAGHDRLRDIWHIHHLLEGVG